MTAPAPFLKWAGGKTKLLQHILPALPSRIDTYYEPFLGGGAVFFALAKEKRFRRAKLSDWNMELVDLYRSLRDDVEGVLQALEPWVDRVRDPEAFYALRARDPWQMCAAERAARFIFLNKTCFNGLYRVNRKGQFNVPFGRYARPKVRDPEKLRAAHRALQGVEIEQADFEVAVRDARRGDAIYLDPPYVPLSRTASFTSYTKSPFGPMEQERLANVVTAALHRGVSAVLSNSDCDETRALYRDLAFRVVPAPRAINRDATRRGSVDELMVVGLAAQAPRAASRARPRLRAVGDGA
mgnify:CR=1 FL=1